MDKVQGVLHQTMAVASLAASYFFGGWSHLLALLLALVVIDYITGVLAAAREGKLKSSVGFMGIARKVLIFTMVAVGHMIDVTLGDAHLFRDAVTFFYLANELLSIIENSGRLGMPMPPALKSAVELFESKKEVSKE